MYKLVVSELAHDDLRGIVKYIKNNLCATGAAADTANEVQRCYARLKENPHMYALCNDERLADMGYRKALVKNYILVFTIDGTERAVNVNRFFYGAEDYYSKI